MMSHDLGRGGLGECRCQQRRRSPNGERDPLPVPVPGWSFTVSGLDVPADRINNSNPADPGRERPRVKREPLAPWTLSALSHPELVCRPVESSLLYLALEQVLPGTGSSLGPLRVIYGQASAVHGVM